MLVMELLREEGMQLTILSVAYPLTQVGQNAVGGSEQILTAIDLALTKAGHRSLVLAAEGSQVSGTLIASPKAGKYLNDRARERGTQIHRRLLNRTLNDYAVDLVHMHNLDFHRYLPIGREPVLATLHLPPEWYPQEIFERRGPRFRMNCVSETQLAACPPCAATLHVISNGVDVERLHMEGPRGDYAVAMGRICPEKGFHLALDAARMADVPLRLAGEVFPYQWHRRYFRNMIRPRLDSQRTFIGSADFMAKRQLLASAKCLVVPSTVAETSCLVAMEALACGTPVVAFNVGALPEVIDHGKTGFIVSNVQEMAAAMHKLHDIDREACRRSAKLRFSSERMTAEYLQLYERMARQDVRRAAKARVA
jgi:glycosyltransferase involved in cell wall biosynthesis